jgi:hypothetical protein
MTKDNEKDRKAKAISMLFTAFGQGSEAERMAMYVKKLQDVPADVLDKACDKVIMECKYLPSIAELVQAAKALVKEANGTADLPFAEVWKEIMQQLHETYFDWEEGTFSRKEIAELVRCIGGLKELRMMTTAEEPVIRAQMNKMYDGICARNKEKENNGYILGTAVLIDSGKDVRLILK